MIVHPTLLRLLETGREAQASGDLSSLSALVSPARAFLIEQQGLFEALAIAIPLRAELGDRVADIRSLFGQALSALEQIEAGRAFGLDSLEAAMKELLPSLGALDEAERAFPRQSPMPIVNRFIRIAANVREGFLEPGLLREHFGSVVQNVRTLAQNQRRFRALYPTPPGLLDEWDREFGRLEAGCGAMLAWFDNGEDATLLDALKLLKFSSTALMAMLARMDEVARAELGEARLPAVAELQRAAALFREGRVEAEAVVLTASILQSLGGYYASALDTVPVFPLAFMLRAELDDLRAAMTELGEVALPWFARLPADPAGACRDMELLERMRLRFESACAAHQRLQDALSAHTEALAGATNLQEVVDVLGRYSLQTVSASHALDRVEHFLAIHSDLVEQIDRSGADLGEMRDLLLEQALAVEEMARILEDGDEEHLRNGYIRLCAIHPRAMELQGEMRAVADAQRQARERTVSCFRCGASNPATQKFCASCAAMLPMAAVDETTYSEIGASGEAGMPATLRQIQTVHDRATRGEALEPLAAELRLLRERLAATARTFDGGLGARAGRGGDSRLAEFASAFRADLQGLIDGVGEMIEGAEGGAPEAVGRGFEGAMAAGLRMQESQRELAAGLGLHAPIS
jgi:hypothetical protein